MKMMDVNEAYLLSLDGLNSYW